jgi:hypothetical protein
MSYVRYDDYDIKYQGNRYDWLGNGYSQSELDQTCNSAYYIRSVDDSPFLSKEKARKVKTGSGTMDPNADARYSFAGPVEVDKAETGFSAKL